MKILIIRNDGIGDLVIFNYFLSQIKFNPNDEIHFCISCNTDSINYLLKNILNSRKTVKQYVNYNLLIIGFILIVAFAAQTMYEPKLQEIINKFGANSNKGYILVFVIYFVFILTSPSQRVGKSSGYIFNNIKVKNIFILNVLSRCNSYTCNI